MKIGISYGFAEGHMQGKQLIKLLRQNGLSVTRKLTEADAIIAHSGGCYLLPEVGKAKVVMLIGFPYWTDKHPKQGLKEKLALEIKDRYWLKKTFFNSIYFVAWPRRWYRMWHAFQGANLPKATSFSSVISIRNENDPFMHPVESEVLAQERGWKVHKLAGGHDDLWHNPEQYVDILLESLQNAGLAPKK